MKLLEVLVLWLVWIFHLVFIRNIRLRIVMKSGYIYKMNVIKWSVKNDSTGRITDLVTEQYNIRGRHVHIKLSEIDIIYES
jgi:hypothetical protein